jgi:predicted anti-sigma-YlaC factor YlaD
MTCEEHKPKLSAYVDGELPADERERLEEHLAACEECRQELAELASLKEELKMIRFKEPTDAEIEQFWRSVYNRLERGIGWILFSVGAIVLLCYGAFKLVEEIIRDPTVAWAVKIGVVALLFGGVILFVSLLRERLAIRRKDRYSREVRR